MKQAFELETKSQQLRQLPSVDALLKTATGEEANSKIASDNLTELARSAIERVREELRTANTNTNFSREELLQRAQAILRESLAIFERRRLQRVINATGVIVHTNLGRAPLAEKALQAIVETAASYCTLEYDLETGARGRRGRAVEELLCGLTGAESALVVNNCAAAALLVLSALAAGGESIVSRGELVEIGGDFRVPDVMAQSQTKLVEVGTTNRTKLKDFANAITPATKLLARVHPSNFRIVGFTEMPTLESLSQLAHDKDILLYEDAGSGALIDLSQYGLADEPVIARSIAAGVDVVSFSGDKLLGGVQAGLIVGKSEVIERLRKHPLYRALRVDKTAYAALAATLEIYCRNRQLAEIPVLRMITQTREQIERRVHEFIDVLKQKQSEQQRWALNFEMVDGISAIGGGSAPLTKLSTVLIALAHHSLSISQLEERLRFASPPVIGRISESKLLLDLRTVSEPETPQLLQALEKAALMR